MNRPATPPLKAAPDDEDIAEQARPGQGIPSQDPSSAAQFPLTPEEAEREAKSVLVGGGVLAGAATGAAIGTAVGGPVGTVVGGTLGAVAGALGGAAAGTAQQLASKENATLQNAPMYAYLPAQDMVRARLFYEGTLGFKPAEEQADGVTYRFGDHTGCFLYPTPNAGTSKASQAFWQVEDVEREVAQLQARGVQLERYDMQGKKTCDGLVIEAGGAKAAWFKDTEGNILALVQGV